jgi:hypothetical protein
MRTRRHRHRGLLLAAALVGMVAPALVTGPSAQGATPALQVGVATLPHHFNSQDEEIANLESWLGQPFGVVRVFKQWDEPFPNPYEKWLLDHNHRLVISLKSERIDGTPIRWEDIAAATPGTPLYDYVAGLADKINDLDGTVYFVFHHEPEVKGHEIFGDAPQFIAAWRNVVGIFRAVEADNVKFLLTLTDHSYRVPLTDVRAADTWYPGDDYVDAIGADTYNWYNCRTAGGDWTSLDVLLAGHRKFGERHPTKELWLPELGSLEDPADPGRKAAWLDAARAMFKKPEWQQYKGLIYFNSEHNNARFPNCDWWIDSTDESLLAFGDWMNDPYYGGDGGTPPPPSSRIIAAIDVGGFGYRSAVREVPVTTVVDPNDP